MIGVIGDIPMVPQLQPLVNILEHMMEMMTKLILSLLKHAMLAPLD